MGKLKALFGPQHTFTIHLIQLTLIVLVFILAIVRVSMTEVPITRANIMFIPIVRILSSPPTHPETREQHIDILKRTAEPQVPHHHLVPAPNRTQRAFSEMGKPKGKHDPQHDRGALLGRAHGAGVQLRLHHMHWRELRRYRSPRRPSPRLDVSGAGP